MPLTYRIDPDTQMLFVIGEGVITQTERIETMLTWLKDPAFRPSLDTFCDFSAAESTPTTLELGELVKLIKRHAEAIGPKKLAVLAAKPVTFGVARIFEAMTDVGKTPIEVGVFYDRNDAWAWLRPAPAP
jgi:hypothetical protein